MRQRINLLSLRLKGCCRASKPQQLVLHEIYQQQLADLENSGVEMHPFILFDAHGQWSTLKAIFEY